MPWLIGLYLHALSFNFARHSPFVFMRITLALCRASAPTPPSRTPPNHELLLTTTNHTGGTSKLGTSSAYSPHRSALDLPSFQSRLAMMERLRHGRAPTRRFTRMIFDPASPRSLLPVIGRPSPAWPSAATRGSCSAAAMTARSRCGTWTRCAT